MDGERRYRIGELAELTGVSRRTVRYYVQRGLIDPPLGRGRGAHYSERHRGQIQAVRAAQRAGAGLDEIATGGGPAAQPQGQVQPDSDAAPRPAETDAERGWVGRWVVSLELRPGVRLEVDAAGLALDAAALETLRAGCLRALADAGIADERGDGPRRG